MMNGMELLQSFGVSIDRLLVMLANIIIVSVPEEFFIVVFTLILFKYFDAFDMRLKNVFRLLVPVLFPAILSNIMRYTGIDMSIVFPVSILFIYTLLLMSCRMWKLSEAMKLLISLMVSVIVLELIELSYMPVVFYATGKTVDDFNQSVLSNFILTLPERTVEYALVYLLLISRLSCHSVNVVKKLNRSFSLKVQAIAILLVNIIFLFIACRLIGCNKVLANLQFLAQLLVIAGALMFPVINVTIFWGMVHRLLEEETDDINYFEVRLAVLADSIKRYYKSGEFDVINNMACKVEEDMEERKKRRR